MICSRNCRRNADASIAPDDAGLSLLVERLAREGAEEVLARLAAGGAEGAH